MKIPFRSFAGALLLAASFYSCSPAKATPPPQPLERIIFIEKSSHTLLLYKGRGGEWELEKRYAVGVGRMPGDKQYEGDCRTPDGDYFITGKMYDRSYRWPGDDMLNQLNELMNGAYGSAAFVLNYPNDEDIAQGKTGSNIWLHGTRQPWMVGKDSSRGCAILRDEDVRDLDSRVGLGTPVKIREKLVFVENVTTK